MFVYRNANNGDEVAYPVRRARLDRLPNWELVSSPADPPVPAVEVPESVPGPAPKRPGKAEAKAVWEAYIAATTDLSDAEAHDLTKAGLVALANDE